MQRLKNLRKRPDRKRRLKLGEPRRPRWLLRVHDADELRIECDRPLPLQVDGEDLGDVTAATLTGLRIELTTRVDSASPSTSSAMISSGLLPSARTFSSSGSRSAIAEIFPWCSRM